MEKDESTNDFQEIFHFLFLTPKRRDLISLRVSSANPKQTPQNTDSTLAPRTVDNGWFRCQAMSQELTEQIKGTAQS